MTTDKIQKKGTVPFLKGLISSRDTPRLAALQGPRSSHSLRPR